MASGFEPRGTVDPSRRTRGPEDEWRNRVACGRLPVLARAIPADRFDIGRLEQVSRGRHHWEAAGFLKGRPIGGAEWIAMTITSGSVRAVAIQFQEQVRAAMGVECMRDVTNAEYRLPMRLHSA